MRGVWRLKQWGKRVVPQAAILLYHRVAELESDPQLLCVTPQHFAEHLEVLARDYHPLSLRDLLARRSSNLRWPRSVVVTFDDGYADNLHQARPLLERHDVPATVFVVAGELAEAHEFWWDDLARILLETPSLPELLQLTIAGRAHAWHLSTAASSNTDDRSSSQGWHVLRRTDPSPRHGAYREIAALLRPLDRNARGQVLARLATWAGSGSVGRPQYARLGVAEIQALACPGLVEVGSHTLTHPLLAALPVEMQQAEIFGSKECLENILGQPLTSFSYPFGGRADYTAETVRLVREAGFACACSNVPGLIQSVADPFQLPRFLVRDWNGDEFARRLAKWVAA